MIAKILTTSLLMLFTSCNSSKETVQETNSNVMHNEKANHKAMEAEMISDGFHLGELKYLKDSECSYIIIDKTTNTNFDPVNILEESYNPFLNDGEKVYFKYRPLRRMNRCTEANPIELIDIKKREG